MSAIDNLSTPSLTFHFDPGSHEEHTEEGWTSYHEEEGYYNGEQDEDD